MSFFPNKFFLGYFNKAALFFVFVIIGVLSPQFFDLDNNIAKATTFAEPTLISENAPGENNMLKLKKINDIYYLLNKPSGVGPLKLSTSTDGASWSSFIDLVNVIRDYDFGYYNNGGYYYLVFSYNSNTEILITTSTDAITWSATSTVIADLDTDGSPIFMSTAVGSDFLAIAYPSFDGDLEELNYFIATSINGVDWATSTIVNNVYSLDGLVIDESNNPHVIYSLPSDNLFNTSTEIHSVYANSTDDGVTWTTTTIDKIDYQFFAPENFQTLALDNDNNPAIVYYKIDDLDTEGDCLWDDVDSSWGGDCNVTTSLRYARYTGSVWASSTAATFPLSIASTSFGFVMRPSLTFGENNEALFAGAGPNFYPYFISNTNTLNISQFAITQIDDKVLDGINMGGSSGLSLVFDTSTLSVFFAFVGSDPVTPTDRDVFFTTSTVVVAPATPTGLVATPSTTTQIDLTWNSSVGATSYILYKSINNFSTTSTVTTTALTSYSDTGLMASTQYYYKVAAVNEIGTGVVSASVNTTTLAGMLAYDGDLPVVPAGSTQKLLYVNDLYYLAFSSSTGGLFDIYITTSTNGGDGTWSEPLVISTENIKKESSSGEPFFFDFIYNSTVNNFGLVYCATSTSITYFTTSTNAVSWSTKVNTISPVDGYLSFDYQGNNVLVVSKNNTTGIHRSRSSYSTNGGSSWVTSTVFTRDVSAADGGSTILSSKIGSDGSLHTLFYSGGNGTTVPHQLIYASSTDNGVSWSTTTVGTEIGDDSVRLELGAMGLDSNNNPGVLYLEANDYNAGAITTTVRIAKRSALGVWTTSTIYYPASATGISGLPHFPKLEFVGSDYPLVFHFGNNYNPTWSISTTTDPYVFTNNTINADVVGNNTSFGLAYVTSTEIVAMSYIDNAGQLYFATSSLTLPVGGSIPNAPSDFTIFNFTTTSMDSSWTDNSSDETGFTIDYSADGESWFLGSSGIAANSTTITLDDLDSNMRMWWRIASFNTFGTSTYATSTTGYYTNPTIPSTPVISSVSTSSLILAWSGDRNSDSTVYYINYTGGFVTTTATTTSIVGLTPSTSYTFAVRAQYLSSSTLYTTYSASSTPTTTLSAGSIPLAPTNFVVSNVVTSTADFSWSDNSSDELGFTIDYSIDGVNWIFGTNEVEANAETFSAGDVQPNIHIWYRIAAFNTFGTSTYVSSTGDYYTPVVPGTPTVSNVSTSSVTATWSDNDNADGTIYYVNYSGGFVTTTATTTNIIDLTPNTQYTFAVRTQYSSSSTLYTAYSASSTPATTTIPVIPGTPSALANGQTSMIVSWSANSNSSDTLYQVYNYTDSEVEGTTTSTSHAVTGLTANTSYRFNVRAQYQSDDSTYTAYSSTSTAVSTAAVASTVTMTLNTGASSTFQLSAGGTTHTATLDSVSNGVATVTVASTPFTVSLSAGQSSNNAANGITVTMNSVGASSASFSLSTYTAPVVSSGSGGISSPKVPVLVSFTINNGVKTTNSRIVALSLNVSNASLMVISNSDYFNSYSYIPFQSNPSWTLSSGDGLKTVYVRLRSSDGGEILVTQSITLNETTTSNTQTVATPSQPQVGSQSSVQAPYQFTKDLKIGSTGTAVKQLQIKLKSLGYFTYPTITSYYGSATANAVKKLQVANKLKATGIVDKTTRNILNNTQVQEELVEEPKVSIPTTNYTFAKLLSYGMKGEEVKQLQIRLQELGYLSKSIIPTLNFGPATKAAVIKLQKEHNLTPALGYAGPGTRKVLNGE